MAAMRKDDADAFHGSHGNKMEAPVGNSAYVTKVRVMPLRSKVDSPETPLPDYDNDMPGGGGSLCSPSHRNSFKFVANFQNIISNISSIEQHYSNYPEPDPDYLNDEDDGNNSSSHRHQQQLRSPGWRKSHHSNGAGASSDTSGEFPPPPPPLTAEDLASAVSEAYEAQVQNGNSPTAPDGGLSTEDQSVQIKPKPLHNPCVESKERQALHRELISNYKLGKDVLQKPELNKVLRDRREIQRKKEWEDQKSSKGRTSLEVKLEERRIREEEEAKMRVIQEDEASAPELLRMHKKITHKLAGEQS